MHQPTAFSDEQERLRNDWLTWLPRLSTYCPNFTQSDSTQQGSLHTLNVPNDSMWEAH